MACSTHLLSQSLYPSHRSNPAAPRHLRFQARRPAAASPVVRSSFSPRSRRAFGLRVAASAEQGEASGGNRLDYPSYLPELGTSVTELVVYAPESKFNQLADQVDKDAGITRLNLFSPCKINVFLRITGKRPDGFHNLASLFHVISLGDTIKFSLSPSKSKDRLSTNVAGVPVDESNLIIKALNLYRKKTGTDKFFWIHLDKKVPTGAGLGGGSSNAATALWAANQFSGCIASEKDLQEWSGEIGSDIPFFFSRGAAYCTGRGEIVQDIPNPLPVNFPMVLIKPPEACSTAEVYKRLRLEQTSRADPLTLLKGITQNGISQDACVNDLEPPAFEVLPSLKKLKKRIIAANRGDYSAVFMSGSGSTIVGIGSPDPPAFVYDDDDYKDVFVSEACFLTRNENEWYREPISSKATFSKEDLPPEVASVAD